MRRILYTRSVDAWRWRRHQPDPAPLSDTAATAQDPGPEADARLTPRQRAVLVLRFYEDRTETVTAQILGCSPNTVESQIRHALERLRVLAPELAATFGREEAPR